MGQRAGVEWKGPSTGVNGSKHWSGCDLPEKVFRRTLQTLAGNMGKSDGTKPLATAGL